MTLTSVRTVLLLLGALTLLGLAACEDSAPVAQAPRAVKPKPVKNVAEKVKEKLPEAKKADYVYSSEGMRDPFLPLLQEKRPVPGKAVPLTPLQKFDLTQFRILGIIVGKGQPRAMVSAPGGKSFILKKGLKIGKNNGTVTSITTDGVTVLEKYYDFNGAVRTSEKMIKLPPRRGVD